jgi:hypothetical protein
MGTRLTIHLWSHQTPGVSKMTINVQLLNGKVKAKAISKPSGQKP